MMALALLADTALAAPVTVSAPVTNPLAGPDVAPMHAAVAACDRDTMARLNRAEPHRRAEFALAVYAEQRAIAAERAALPVMPAVAPAPGKVASSPGKVASVVPAPVKASASETVRASLDARQRRLDDARATEQTWRTAVDELRADFLANCERKRD